MTDDGARRAGHWPGAPGGLLAVHAHPDDETLSTGALLATWAATGRPVTVVTCTRGEQGEVIGDRLRHLDGDPAALASHREGELAAALRALGVTDHTFLDRVGADPTGGPAGPAGSGPDGGGPGADGPRYSDSGMAWLAPGRAGPAPRRAADAFVDVAVDVAAGRLAALLRDRRPEVVVGYEPGGGYGHPDHVHAHRVMMRAVELASAPDHRAGDGATAGSGWQVPVVLWSVLDAAALRAGLRACVRAVEDGAATAAGPLLAPDPHGVLPSAASEQVDVAVPLLPVLGRVRAALTAYASQVQGMRPGPSTAPLLLALSHRVLQPVLPVETYRVAVRAGAVRWPDGVRVA